MPKPTVFVGSSTEGLPYARAIRENLSDTAEISLWNEDFANPGSTFIETLIERADDFDFAVLVLTPDVLNESRDVRTFGPRDNLLFEIGLFMASIGRERTLIVQPDDAAVTLPSDLAGLQTIPFEAHRSDNSHQRAVGAASDRMRRVIVRLGQAKAIDEQLRAIESRQTTQEAALARQQTEIQSLRVALRGIVTGHELDKLHGLAGDAPFRVRARLELLNELGRLRSLGLIHNHPGVGLRVIARQYGSGEERFDLKEFFYITHDGQEYLRLRDELDALIDAD
jgi:hypothetical protein